MWKWNSVFVNIFFADNFWGKILSNWKTEKFDAIETNMEIFLRYICTSLIFTEIIGSLIQRQYIL